MTNGQRGGDDWAAELVRRVGLAAKEARKGKSAAWLSDRTTELGYRIPPTVIAKLDSGHRGSVLYVAELLILAAALGVPPLALLFPDITSPEIDVLPAKPVPEYSALAWFIGAGGSVGLTQDYLYAPEGVATSDAMRIPLRLLQIDDALMQQRHSLLQSERGPEVFTMPDEVRESMKQRAEATREVIRVLEEERGRLLDVYKGQADA